MKAVEIEFVSEWMGNDPGSVRVVWKRVADELVRRGVARVVGETNAKANFDVVIASMDEPTEDKMMRSPSKKKIIRK